MTSEANSNRLLIGILFILLIAGHANAATTNHNARTTTSAGIKLVRIPAGEFEMGQPAGEAWQQGGEWDETPVHKVRLTEPIRMSETEITNIQYEEFDPEHRKLRGAFGFSTGDDEPVVQVSWNDAIAFCKWLSEKEGKTYRLPTEAEWEYACRAGTTTPYFTGDSLPAEFGREQMNYDNWDENHRTPVDLTVAQSPPNAWGLYDMAGNVEEWCSDWYGPYPSTVATNPVGHAKGISRVTRGGSHNTDPYLLRSANRMSALPEDRNYLLGFRVVQADVRDSAPLLELPPARTMADVSQEKAIQNPVRYDPDTPYFRTPQPYVNLPAQPQGPIFSFHNHDPALIDCPNGDLLAIWYSTQREWGPELCVVGSRLRAGADKWDEASLFFDLADRNEHGPAFGRGPSGEIYHFNGVGISGWGDLATIMRTSTDSGATWSAPTFIKPERQAPYGCVESVFITSSEKLIVPLDGPDSSTELLISDDKKTFVNPAKGSPADTFTDGSTGHRIAGIHAALTELKNGDLYAIGRGSNINGKSPVSLSKDGGKSWTYSASEFPPSGSGQRPLLLRLNEGPILYIGFTDALKKMGPFELGKERERVLHHNGMKVLDAANEPRTVYGMFAALSFDEGKSWPVKKLLTPGGPPKEYYGHGWTKKFIMDENNAEPMGYPSITQAPDGRIHLISSGIYYSFNLAWLKEPMPAGNKQNTVRPGRLKKQAKDIHTCTRKLGDTLWSNKNQWNTGTLPGRTDEVVINADKTLTIDTDAIINSILAPNVSGHKATLIVPCEIKLEANMICIGRGAYSGATSLMNHSAGTVDAGTLYVAAGEGSTSTYNLSGSAVLTGTTLDIGQVSDARSTGSVTFNQSGGTVSMETVQIAGKADVSYILSDGKMEATDLNIGSGASPARSTFRIGAGADSVLVANDLIAGPRAELVFELSETGTTPIAVSKHFQIKSTSAKLMIDATKYSGKEDTIDLITFDSISSEFSAVEVEHLDSALTASIGYNSRSMYLRITAKQD
jgi:formylglycine-generating enzyme required for sulfatase activity